jgi:uncharacterized membrane protein YdfJ with MMPL/SSD domain
VLNLLGLSAMFGILVLIFQDGRFEGLLSYSSQGGLASTQMLFLFAVVFGLSTDYGVFLLSRIKEARDGGYSDAEAVALGSSAPAASSPRQQCSSRSQSARSSRRSSSSSRSSGSGRRSPC